MVNGDWCISILTVCMVVSDWRISVFVVQTTRCSHVQDNEIMV